MTANKTTRHILFVVEGEVTEPTLIESMMKALGLGDKYSPVVYGTTIHDLLDLLDREYGGQYENVDIRSALASIKPEDRHILSQNFSDIVLVFDYDPQDNRFNPQRLAKLMSAFNESTNLGKLYINYPMAESFKHFTSFDEKSYLDTTVKLEEVKKYKQIVAECNTVLKSPKELEQGLTLACVVALNATKIEKLTSANHHIPYENLAERCAALDLKSLLRIQNDMQGQQHAIFVCNTSVLFVSDWSRALNGMWKKALAKENPRYKRASS